MTRTRVTTPTPLIYAMLCYKVGGMSDQHFALPRAGDEHAPNIPRPGPCKHSIDLACPALLSAAHQARIDPPYTPHTTRLPGTQRRRSSLDGWSSGTRAAPGRCRTAHHRASAACLASHLCIMRGGCRYRYPDMERFFQQASPYQEGSAARAVLEGVAWRPREHLSPCGSTRGPRQRSCA